MGNFVSCGSTSAKLSFFVLSVSVCLNAGLAFAQNITFSTRVNGDEADCTLDVRTSSRREALTFHSGLARCNVYGQEDVSGTMQLITSAQYGSRNTGHYAIAGRDNCYVGGSNMTGYRIAYPEGLSNTEAIDWCLDRNPRLQQIRETLRPSYSAPTYRF